MIMQQRGPSGMTLQQQQQLQQNMQAQNMQAQNMQNTQVYYGSEMM